MCDGIEEIDENWYSLDGFKYKTMMYPHSCFPCSLHIAYANLGRIAASGSEIEKEWNTLSGGLLEDDGLTPEQIVQCMRKTKYDLTDCYSLFTPEYFGSEADTKNVISKVNETFMSNTSYAMITATAHAEVFYRTDENRVFFCCPSPEQDDKCNCYEIEISRIEATEDSRNLYKAAILYRIKEDKSGNEYAVMANCIMTIK